MTISLKQLFRGTALVGLVVLFLSMFLDWYSIGIYNTEGALVGSWIYNIMGEWSTNFTEEATINTLLRPNPLEVPQVINIILFGTILLVLYGILFQDIENQENFDRAKSFSYLNIFLLLLNGFYILILPVAYLTSSNLYFPFLVFRDEPLGVIIYYSVGFGYLLQAISFVLMFPYFVFSYKTLERFEKREYSAEKVIGRYISKHQEVLDLDKYIGEEKQKIDNLDINHKIEVRTLE